MFRKNLKESLNFIIQLLKPCWRGKNKLVLLEWTGSVVLEELEIENVKMYGTSPLKCMWMACISQNEEIFSDVDKVYILMHVKMLVSPSRLSPLALLTSAVFWCTKNSLQLLAPHIVTKCYNYSGENKKKIRSWYL